MKTTLPFRLKYFSLNNYENCDINLPSIYDKPLHQVTISIPHNGSVIYPVNISINVAVDKSYFWYVDNIIHQSATVETYWLFIPVEKSIQIRLENYRKLEL